MQSSLDKACRIKRSKGSSIERYDKIKEIDEFMRERRRKRPNIKTA